MNFRTILHASLLACALLGLAACAPADEAADPAAGGDAAPDAGGAATTVAAFDPADWSTESAGETSGTCRAMTELAAYACETEGGGTLAPCFPLGDGRVGCSPSPIPEPALRTVLTPTGALPPLPAPTGLAFLVQLDDQLPCTIRTEPVEIAGQTLRYGCDAPGAWLTGPPDDAQPVWTAQQVITDPSGVDITSGPTTRGLLAAWTDG